LLPFSIGGQPSQFVNGSGELECGKKSIHKRGFGALSAMLLLEKGHRRLGLDEFVTLGPAYVNGPAE